MHREIRVSSTCRAQLRRLLKSAAATLNPAQRWILVRVHAPVVRQPGRVRKSPLSPLQHLSRVSARSCSDAHSEVCNGATDMFLSGLDATTTRLEVIDMSLPLTSGVGVHRDPRDSPRCLIPSAARSWWWKDRPRNRWLISR